MSKRLKLSIFPPPEVSRGDDDGSEDDFEMPLGQVIPETPDLEDHDTAFIIDDSLLVPDMVESISGRDEEIQCNIKPEMASKGTQIAPSTGSYQRKGLRSQPDELTKNMMTHKRLIREILCCKDFTIAYLMELGVIKSERICPDCGDKMIMKQQDDVSDGYKWRCQKRGTPGHSNNLSIRHGSWFALAKLTLEELVEFSYHWVRGKSQLAIQFELGLSSNTSVDWSSFSREVCEETMFKLSEGTKIGGKEKIVEIDESKFAKRKYHVGHEVKSGWVFGGVERDSEGRKCFLRVVPDRSATTLITIIEEQVAEGTTIYSDCWKAYSRLGEKGYNHMTVNHTYNFKDPETGVHTNTIEGLWQKVKHNPYMPQFGVREDHLKSYLGVFMWLCRKKGMDYFREFMKDASKVYDGRCKDDDCKYCSE